MPTTEIEKPATKTLAVEKKPVDKKPELSQELKDELKKATGSATKKAAWWAAGVIGVFLALVLGIVGILFVLKKKGPLAAVDAVIKKTKTELAKSDMDEKIKVAEAKGAEKVVIDKLKEIKEIDDEKQRLEELNALLGDTIGD